MRVSELGPQAGDLIQGGGLDLGAHRDGAVGVAGDPVHDGLEGIRGAVLWQEWPPVVDHRDAGCVQAGEVRSQGVVVDAALDVGDKSGVTEVDQDRQSPPRGCG